MNIRKECVAWYIINDKVVKDFDPRYDADAIIAYENLTKNDRYTINSLFKLTNSWMKKRNLYEYVN